MNNKDKNYNEALDFLFSRLPMFSRIGAPAYKPGLDTSLNLDKHFNHPHKKFKSIHIAGTNGKGSSSHMIASILQEAGFKTGLYTSPHLVDFRERMKINGEMIAKDAVVCFVERWKKSDFDGYPSFFELTMMMAFDWFASENVDFAVIEVGMGGRLDSTNIITPELSVITNISLDHTQFLGSTLQEIAKEKAGIIKSGIPVVIGEATDEIRNVFEETAKNMNAPIFFAEDNPKLINIEGGQQGLICRIQELQFTVPLSGDYQKKNINTVLHTADIMLEQGIKISQKNILDGLENVVKNTGLKGRWTILNQNPLVICDTGHNIAGISYNMHQLQTLLQEKPNATLRMVIGFVADKDIDHIIPLLPDNVEYFITQASIPRALPVDVLERRFYEYGKSGRKFHDVYSAYKEALKLSSPDDILFIGGSTFIVADLLAAID